MEKPYVPIDCGFYDELELLAMRQTPCSLLVRLPNDEIVRWVGVIKTFETRQGAEYMILRDGRELRLDQLVEVNGKRPPGFC
jgi:Rho-binding antiterminator